MPEEMVLRLAKQTLETVLLVSSPMLGAGLVVGVLILIRPALLSYLVAIYLIIAGALGLAPFVQRALNV